MTQGPTPPQHDTLGELTQQLAAAQGRLDEVLALNRIGSWEWHVVTGEVSWSVQTYEILGLTPGDSLPSYATALAAVHPEDAPRYEAALAQCLAGEDRYEFSNRIIRGDGMIRHIVSRGQVHRDAAGQATRMFGTLQDITDATSEAYRTEALEKQASRKSALESLGHMAAGIAHDFNNALLPLSLAVDELATPCSTARAHEIGLELAESLEYATALPRDLMAFGRNPTERLPHDINALVHDTAGMLSRSLRSTTTLEVGPSDEPLMCSIDRSQIRQVLTNLVLNSQDAMPAGGRIRVETRSLPGPNAGWVAVDVIDQGQGMDAQTQEHMFDPFYTTKQHGSGLGLAISHAIMAQHEGEIRVSSTTGEGTTMTMLFARLDVPADIVARRTAPQTVVEPPATPTTILVVEDIPRIRKHLARTLERLGYATIVVGDGAAAILAAKAHHGAIDLLLTDVSLPSASGPQVARTLTELYPDLPVLFMTGHVRADLELPANAQVLLKPFGSDKLANSIITALG